VSDQIARQPVLGGAATAMMQETIADWHAWQSRFTADEDRASLRETSSP
jgi:hypothetical protein